MGCGKKITHAMQLRARSPCIEEIGQVLGVHDSTSINITARLLATGSAPVVEQTSEINAVHGTGLIDVGRAWVTVRALLAAVGDIVGVEIVEIARANLSVVDDAVVVAVGGVFDQRPLDVGNLRVIIPAARISLEPDDLS